MSAIHGADAPMAWVMRGLAQLAPGSPVLDFACGAGRHALLAARQGLSVLAVDRDEAALETLRTETRDVGADIEVMRCDLESGGWPFADRRFAAVVVANYLFRNRLDDLADLVAPGGRLIYATFAVGNARFGRPSNPDFLLAEGELLALAARHSLTVVAYEAGVDPAPRAAQVQRLLAWRPGVPESRPPLA